MNPIQQTVLYEQGMDFDFMEKVHAIPGGGAIKRCIQCGTCSGTCPVSWAMEESPRQIIAMIRAGLRDKVLDSATIWTCASCYSCTARCPQEIKITDVMYILKRLAIAEGRERSKNVQTFSRLFVEIVNDAGRVNEFTLMRRYLLATRPFGAVKESGVGWALKSRGRLPFGAPPVKDLDNLRKIIAKAQQLAGEHHESGGNGQRHGHARSHGGAA
jgi:quinone-modifying oxidoreductase, subunit QmoC